MGGEFFPEDQLSASAATLLLEIGRRHYVDDVSFSDLARDLGLSRFKVARLAKEARARGLIQISVRAPQSIDLAAADDLRLAWPQLVETIVVPTPDSESGVTLRGALAAAAAQLVMERTVTTDVLGLACGRTINEAASLITRLPPCTIVQLTGVTSASVADSSIRAMQRVAAISRGRSFPIYAPMLLDNPALIAALAREPGIAAAQSRFPQLTRALVTIGAWSDTESTLFAACTAQQREQLSEAGVVAEFTGHLLNAAGDVVGRNLTSRCLTVPLKDLVRVPELIVVAGGAARVDALGAALRSGLVTRLITDSRTATALAVPA
ncbi:MAG: sugar-binding domain-containing protein [Cryobacterium sp.]